MTRHLIACLLTSLALPAWSADSTNAETTAPRSNLTLKTAAVIEAAPQQGGRFTMRARFAPAESAGELREGANFTLIGRFAKGGMSCDFTAIFSDGFEGN